ncbi:response regulator [Rivularia sp. PCC 7116]|uniref:response regulator n=1 Tax=Rivularia sp. PCC 7116 TaxID=373994 RepID=UPI0002DB115C
MLSTILQNHNYKVRQAVNAEIALKTIELQLPDLILLDILMPEVDGINCVSKSKIIF